MNSFYEELQNRLDNPSMQRGILLVGSILTTAIEKKKILLEELPSSIRLRIEQSGRDINDMLSEYKEVEEEATKVGETLPITKAKYRLKNRAQKIVSLDEEARNKHNFFLVTYLNEDWDAVVEILGPWLELPQPPGDVE